MNRLQKKCFIGSAGVHFLMFGILLIGPAFLSSKQKPQPVDTQILDFIPSKLVDGPSGGGNRNAKPPPAAPPAPPPTAAQPPAKAVVEKPREPEPAKTEKLSKADPDSVELKTAPKPHRPQINTTLVPRKSDTTKPSKTKSSDTDTQAQERQLADIRQRASQQIASTAAMLREATSSVTSIEEYGPGTGGSSRANYAAFVRTVYENAWQAPDDTATDQAITKVSVTIRSDGTVIAHQISRPSGDAQVDRSVQRTLERVTFIAPFPEGAKEKQRTYIINFNLKAKRGLA
jgi:TonB family protein